MGVTNSCCNHEKKASDNQESQEWVKPRPAPAHKDAPTLVGIPDLDRAGVNFTVGFSNGAKEQLVEPNLPPARRWQCPQCGFLSPQGDRFCPQCSKQRPDDAGEKRHGRNYNAVLRLLEKLSKESAPVVSEADATQLGVSLNACMDESNFNLDTIRFSPASFAALCKQLSAGALPKLPGLSLARFGSTIGEPGARALAEASARGAFGSLEELLLSNNGLQDAGTQAFCKACTKQSFPRMRKLVLEQNQIGDAGATAISEAIILADFPKLYTLDLTDNVVGDVGAKALAKAATNRDLHTLELDGNQIRNGGAMAFARSNMGSAHLHDLSLRRNPIGMSGKVMLKKVSVIINVQL